LTVEYIVKINIELSECLDKMGLKDDAIKELTDLLNNIEINNLKSEIYKAIADILDEDKEADIRAIALLKSVEYAPNNQSYIFDAAYALSHTQIPELSVITYDTLLKLNAKHSSALNNIGVQFSELGMPFKSIEYYNKSAEENNTLAMANIANKFMNKGFENDALMILNKAKSYDNPHSNVNLALANIKEKKDQENNTLSLIESVAIKQKMFFSEYADAYFKPLSKDLDINGEWVSDSNNIFTITREDKTIKAIWDSNKEGMKCEGSLNNKASKIKFYKKTWSYFKLLKNEYEWDDTPKTGYLYISNESTTVKIYVKDLDHLYLILKRTT